MSENLIDSDAVVLITLSTAAKRVKPGSDCRTFTGLFKSKKLRRRLISNKLQKQKKSKALFLEVGRYS